VTHIRALVLLAALAALASPSPGRAAATPLTVEEAIRAAWARNPALRASSAQVESARADARRARDARLPSLRLEVRGVRTDEPMMAFGLKLDQARIAAPDFDPRRLDDPDAIGGVGASATVSVPVFMGGRLLAGQRAAERMAESEAGDDQRRRMEVAAAVVEAYFGAQAAEQGVRFADDHLAHARETERIVRDRNAHGLLLDSEVARAVAFRAQAEAELAGARRRAGSARSALALLTEEPADALLATPLADPGPGAAPEAPAAGPLDPSDVRPDVRAARLRREAAAAGVIAARGGLLPAVLAQASAETMRTPDLKDGARWTTLGVVLRWDLSLADLDASRAAAARARAADDALAWRRRQAAREVEEARGAVEAADARVAAAREAVIASGSARALREARHREGLLPLADVLDAEAALAGARALLLASQLEARTARAALALALHQPIEGMLP
jgi:outer membrane protein TolC